MRDFRTAGTAIALLFLSLPHPAVQALPVKTEIGAVETIAGPGYCGHPARVTPESIAVRALAVDVQGNTFVDTGVPAEGLVARVDRLGEATTIQTGSSEVSVGRLVPDGTGGVFVAARSRIEQVGGNVPRRVIAGDANAAPNGGEGSSGDRGPAAAARFSRILSMASDGSGNLYVADEIDGQHNTLRIRFLNLGDKPISFYAGTAHELMVAPGNIETVAGSSGDPTANGSRPAREARLQGSPPAMAAAPGKLYLAMLSGPRSALRSTVRLINFGGETVQVHGVTAPPAAITTVAGRGRAGSSPDGGPALRAALSRIKGMAIDEAGSLLLADEGNNRIRAVGKNGTITTVAGRAGRKGGFNGNGRNARQALLNRPFDVKTGPGGLIYISDHMNGQLRFVGKSGRIQAAAGNGLHLSWDCFRGQPYVLNRLPPGNPVGVAGDKQGNAYFLLNGNPQVFKSDPSGRVEPFVGAARPPSNCAMPRNCPNGDKGKPLGSFLSSPSALAVHPKRGLYVLEGDTGRVRFVNLGGRDLKVHGVTVRRGTIQTVVGRAGREPSSTSGQISLSGSGSIAADQRGNLFVADPGLEVVLRVDPRGRVSQVTNIANSVFDTGCCEQPTGVAVDYAGNLYIADGKGSRIWFMNRTSRTVSVHGQTFPAGSINAVAGTGKSGFAGDAGPALQAQLQNPVSLAVDAQRNLYLLDYGEHTVRRVDGSGTMATFAGTGTPSFNGDGLKARLTAFRYPTDIALDLCGNLLIADMVNGRVRRVKLTPGCG